MRPAFLFVIGLATSALLPAQNQGMQLATGVDGGVSYPHDARMVPPTGITVEAWVTYDDSTIPTGAGSGWWPTIGRQNITPQQESWNFRVSAGNTANRALQFIVRASNGGLYAATYNFAPGELATFTHLAATFDGQVIQLFKNGTQVAQFTIPLLSEVQNNGGVLRLGNGDPVAPGNETWNGILDEVRIWPMARSAAEITATLDQELLLLTGGVLVFPLNGSWDSEDGSLLGTPFGNATFAPGAPTLLPIPAAVVPLGQPSSTCVQKPGMLAGSLPQLGNSAFTIWCVRGPRPTVSPAGALFAGALPAPSGQPIVLGLEIAFDLTTLLASAAFAPPTNALGNASFTLPIPNQSSLLGAGWVFQWGFLDTPCGPQGLTASDGLSITVQ
jgi:hypothetical protein